MLPPAMHRRRAHPPTDQSSAPGTRNPIVNVISASDLPTSSSSWPVWHEVGVSAGVRPYPSRTVADVSDAGDRAR